MTWDNQRRQERHPVEQRGWEIIGQMVRRRRHRLGWSQRELQWASDIPQSTISRLETGKLSGLRFSKFARLVASMGGLEPELPAPPRPRYRFWG